MHKSSLENMRYFINKYMDSDKSYKILDLGSQVVDGEINGSYKSLFNNDKWEYCGADVVSGDNVDIVLEKPYKWANIKSRTFDCIVCGQMLEHCEYFWLTILEIRRVLKVNGLCCIIAPSGGGGAQISCGLLSLLSGWNESYSKIRRTYNCGNICSVEQRVI